MRNPFKPRYGWHAELAGVRGAKWWLALFAVTFYYFQNNLANYGYLQFSFPGVTGVYYFGLSPFLLGVLTGLTALKAYNVGKATLLEYVAFQRQPIVETIRRPRMETYEEARARYDAETEGNPHQATNGEFHDFDKGDREKEGLR